MSKKSVSPFSNVSRRQFLISTGAVLAFPTIIPASALGRQDKPAASNRITLGIVGCGGQGLSNMESFLTQKDCQVVAACDVDKKRVQGAVNKVNKHYENENCKGYHDYRELMARSDIDAVMIALPDHWHALAAVEAAQKKKDIYGEKPLARTLGEQQAIVKAVHANGRIWQTGSWQRSLSNFRKAAEIVRNGLIGKVTQVEVGLPHGHHDSGKTAPALLKKMGKNTEGEEYLATVVPGTKEWDLAVTEPPPELDFDMWLGPARKEPYIQARIHKNWRWNYNTGGGQLMDWIGHHCDIAHWGCDFDNSGPIEVEGHGEFPPKDALWNTCTKYRIELKYPRDIHMTIAGGHPNIRPGTKWTGTDGWVYVNRGAFEGSNEDWRDYRDLPDEMRKVKLYESHDHYRNFLDCVKSRKPTITPVATAHHSAIPGHLGLISMLVGRKIKWNARSERILHDAEASKLIMRDYRAPWKLA
jgi:predicted dehydrogenase